MRNHARNQFYSDLELSVSAVGVEGVIIARTLEVDRDGNGASHGRGIFAHQRRQRLCPVLWRQCRNVFFFLASCVLCVSYLIFGFVSEPCFGFGTLGRVALRLRQTLVRRANWNSKLRVLSFPLGGFLLLGVRFPFF